MLRSSYSTVRAENRFAEKISLKLFVLKTNKVIFQVVRKVSKLRYIKFYQKKKTFVMQKRFYANFNDEFLSTLLSLSISLLRHW